MLQTLLDLNIPRRRSEGQPVRPDVKRACEIKEPAIGITNAHVADEREEPGDERDGGPHDAEREEMLDGVDRRRHRGHDVLLVLDLLRVHGAHGRHQMCQTR